MDINKIIRYIAYRGYLDWMSDEKYLKLLFKAHMGKALNLDNPSTLNEKLQWLKIHNRNPEYSKMVDKYEVKKYIDAILGKGLTIPTIGVWDKLEDIDFELLPEQFVLKCTHDSGGLVICTDKRTFDFSKAKKKINKCMKKNYYWSGREWPYKNVRPRIIAEPYMIDKMTNTFNDYKFFCFNGKVKCFKIDFNRFAKHQANYYDIDGNILPFGEVICPPDYSANLTIPKDVDTMIAYAEKIAKDQPFLRVDFYYANSQIYFGEITFYPATGFGKFIPEEWDYKLGNWLNIKL